MKLNVKHVKEEVQLCLYQTAEGTGVNDVKLPSSAPPVSVNLPVSWQEDYVSLQEASLRM